ncbi:hypothetical protein GCM10009765_23320 [Fodinicola feengrottensis]|uniref:Uncharacterized protein n=1 Tax=Fodinicola feengrottensis TaxID=435914 RepID=A0ABN2GM19_9ACTN
MRRLLTSGGLVLPADLRPPHGRLDRHVIAAGEAMRDNPDEQIAPGLAATGFETVSVSQVGGFLHHKRAVKPGADA